MVALNGKRTLAEDLRERFVDEKIKPFFKNIHPEMAIPFYKLFDLLYKDISSVTILNFKDQSNEVKFYDLDQLINEREWKNLAPPPSISGLPIKELFKDYHDQFQKKYSPKFRAVISRNPLFNKMFLGILGSRR